MLDKLCDRYAASSGGIGLGLYLCNQLVRALGGGEGLRVSSPWCDDGSSGAKFEFEGVLTIGFPRVLEPASELAPLSAIVRSDCVRAATRAPAGARARPDRSP